MVRLEEDKDSQVEGVVINTIVLYPLKSRLLVHSRDNGLRMVDLATDVVLRKYKQLNNQRFIQTLSIPLATIVLRILQHFLDKEEFWAVFRTHLNNSIGGKLICKSTSNTFNG
ncbi:uncharacterized protein [Anoplolepis gracilipes]|uniref:uncharacterized protein n=1 Tax=Anoplolepis gracilipes TaxID=354296 RepID=UPI003BA32B6B